MISKSSRMRGLSSGPFPGSISSSNPSPLDAWPLFAAILEMVVELQAAPCLEPTGRAESPSGSCTIGYPSITDTGRHHIGIGYLHSQRIGEVKTHDHVLRDITKLELPSDLRAAWFRPADYLGEDGTSRPSFDMTRQGFTFLVMGWTGEKAAAFKVRYIQ